MRMHKLGSIGRNVITAGLLVVSAAVCIPFALLGSAIFAHAPTNRLLGFFFPWLLIVGTWAQYGRSGRQIVGYRHVFFSLS